MLAWDSVVTVVAMETISDWYGGRSVLLTGATGLIGSHLALRLLDAGAIVHALVHPDDPGGSFLQRAGRFDELLAHRGRLEDAPAVAAAVARSRATVVFHLGAQTQVREARRDPAATFAANVTGTWNLLEACRSGSAGPDAIAVASSDKAYGNSERLPYVETDPLAGTEPYEASKAMTDILAQTYARTYGLPTRIARCGNVYGAGDLNWDRIVPGSVAAFLRDERPIIRSDGSPVRDYVHVDDVVDAYLLLGHRSIAAGTAYNFSSGERMSVLEVLGLVRQAAGSSLEADVRADAVGELAAQYLDSTKARTELGWRPGRRMAESLAEIVAWYRMAA